MSRIHTKADGLFIYAATAYRFLDCRLDRVSRKERLANILQGAGRPQKNLDEIYLNVLRFPAYQQSLLEKEKQRMFSHFRNMLGVIVILRKRGERYRQRRCWLHQPSAADSLFSTDAKHDSPISNQISTHHCHFSLTWAEEGTVT